MSAKPEISVVMSVYNGAKYLLESIESILSQKGVDFEFIIVNDGSTDDTGIILSEYAVQDTRIRFFDQENKGLTHSLIHGCEEAKGNYIARIDVGDVMSPERLKKQKNILEEYPDCVFVSCHTEFFGPKWEYLWVNRGKPDSRSPVSIIPQNPENGLTGDIPCHPSVMFRKKAYESVSGYREQFYYGQDWDLWYRLSEIGNYFIVPEILYKFRILPESISMTNSSYQKAIAECSKGAFIARQCNEDEQPWLEKAAFIYPNQINSTKIYNFHLSTEPGLYFIGEALRRNGDSRCRPYFFSAIRHAPLRIRSYIRFFQSLYMSNHK